MDNKLSSEQSDYTIYLPFRLSNALKTIKPITSFERNLSDLILTVNIDDNLCRFKLAGIKSEALAKDYINRIWAGMNWIVLNYDISFQANMQLQGVAYRPSEGYDYLKGIAKIFHSTDVDDKDGLMNYLDKPAIYKDGLSMAIIPMPFSNIKVTTSNDFETMFPVIEEIVNIPESSKIISAAKLRLALELYNSHFSETSDNAKFITLVMILETLSTPQQKPRVAQDLFDNWEKQIVILQKKLQPNSEEFEALEAIQRELRHKKVDSIRSQVYQLVMTTLSEANDPDAMQLANRTKKIYDSRSTLVHNGFI